MDCEQPLCASLQVKIQEQIDRAVHLITLAPLDRLNWKPDIDGAWPLEMLFGHLLDCLAGFCAALAAAEPERLAYLSELRNLPVNHACSPGEAIQRIGIYAAHIDSGFALLTDADLGRKVPTVFVEGGETLLALFLGNLEHLINHKHQLFTYLKQMGLPVGTAELYRLL